MQGPETTTDGREHPDEMLAEDVTTAPGGGNPPQSDPQREGDERREDPNRIGDPDDDDEYIGDPGGGEQGPRDPDDPAPSRPTNP